MLKIGDFSKLSRVSVKTLRYYDEVGLLNSSQVDRFTGYRYYSIEQIPRLNRILAFKDLGFSLEQIARLLDENLPPAQIRGMLRMKQAEIQDQLEEEQARLRRIEARLRQIEQEDSMPTYDIVLKKVDPQRVISVRDTLPTFGDQVSLWIELANYLISRKTKAAGPSITIYHDPEYCERDVDLETATPVSVSLPESQRVKGRELPGSCSRLPLHVQRHFLQGYSFDRLSVYRHSQTGGIGDGDGAVGVERKSLVGDVLDVIAFRSGYVARQGEARQASQRQVSRPSHAGLKHAAAPHRHTLGTAQVMDGERLAQAAHPTSFNIDHPAGLHFQRLAGVARRKDAFVQADRGDELRLQEMVIPVLVV